MKAETDHDRPSFVEFVIIISLMMSLITLSIDAMLPALPEIGTDLNVRSDNNRQLVVSAIFLGLALGQLFFGPLSDSIGRKPAIFAGYALYISGALLSAFSLNFSIMLLGRIIQGMGVSAPRSITLAIVRDRYEGRSMARVMSLVMTVLILVSMAAPALGQAILGYSSWRGIFVSFILVAGITLIWFAMRMPETLAPESRAAFEWRRIYNATLEIIKNRTAIGYTVSAGLINGAFLGLLNSSQQIFQDQYAVGELFPLYIAIISFVIGLASLLNAQLVMRFGMRFLVWWSLIFIICMGLVALAMGLYLDGKPALGFFMAYIMTSFFCVGILFGNQNSLAMEPLGHVAGLGAAVIGSLSTLIAIPLGTIIGLSFDGTILPLVIGITTLAGIAILVVRWTEGGVKSANA